ncbi:glutamate racemase [uncultured Campylobacter sp.]|uniref:glutamate racemase n=1 Tax=uncultured Campylobacter sp. TaxID=218934 RepID=UPI002631F61D|nr:glutamate racemase [uncultured Campylobacter sp.]
MKIAFFDSGIGGLSVLAEALRRFSGAEFLYFADEDHVPYGTKSRAEIVRLSLDAVGFLVAHGADAVVVACNTATSAAISELRGAFSVPVIGMEPAVKLAADSFGARPTLLIATPLTIAGEKLARLVGRLECETWSLALPHLVEFAQDLEFDSPAVRAYLQQELGQFELTRLGSLVLGCTHFNYFKDVLREILPPHVRIIDGIDGTLNRLASELGGGLKLARGEDLPSRAAKFNADSGVKFGANPSAQGGKFDAERRGAGGGQSIKGKSKRGEGSDESARSEQGAEVCDGDSGKIYYPNGNSVEYFYSGRALNAAQLRKVEIFLKRLDAMRGIS